MKIETNQTNQTPKKGTQVITCRIPVSTWHEYEIACIEDHITMSKIIREGIAEYLNSRQKPIFTLSAE
jgi:hypothetical protein